MLAGRSAGSVAPEERDATPPLPFPPSITPQTRILPKPGEITIRWEDEKLDHRILDESDAAAGPFLIER